MITAIKSGNCCQIPPDFAYRVAANPRLSGDVATFSRAIPFFSVCLGLRVKSHPTSQTLIIMNMLSSVMDSFVDSLFVRLRECGFQARIVSVSHLQELQKDIESLRSHALLDSQFYQDRLAWFNFRIPEDLSKAQSLIVVAVPRPQTRAIFTWDGQRRPLILPPTYTAYNDITKKLKAFSQKY